MHATRWMTPGVLSLSLFLTACGGGGDKTASTLPTWTLTGPDVRIGSVDDPDYAFGDVTGLAVGPDGLVYSIHRGEGAIRKWTADGHPAGTLGHKGKGPGEFTQPISLGFFGDTLWAMDGLGGGLGTRLAEFGLDGTLLGTTNLNLNPGSGDLDNGLPRPARPLRDGRWYGILVRMATDNTDTRPRPYFILDHDAAVVDTVWIERHLAHDNMMARADRMMIGLGQPFSDQPRSVALDDGSVVVADFRVPDQGNGATYTVTKVAATGDTLWRTTVPYNVTPLPRERPESVLNAQIERFPPALKGLADQLRGQLYTPPFVPVVKELQVADDGSVWIHEADSGETGNVWRVFDSEGRPEARLDIPTELRVLAIHDDDIWGVQKDDLDVNYIVRYRVHRSES